jgi:phage replication-related protein YjqB (UPF0714/DUF867 family)
VTKYASYAELARHEALGEDFGVTVVARTGARVLVIAPHGGMIEDGTSEIAGLIAGEDHSLFCFEGLKPDGRNRELHITSHRFDHPDCVALAARHDRVVSVHGCRGVARIFLGGLDVELMHAVAARLAAGGFDAVRDGHQYPGRHPLNICNRGARRGGAQLEITHDLRMSPRRGEIAAAVRRALADLAEPAT